MIIAEGVLMFALYLTLALVFISFKSGVWPWELTVYRKEKKAKN